MKKVSRPALIALSGVVALGLIGGGTATAIAMDTDAVTVTTDGQVQNVSTRAKDVQGLLDQLNITVGEHDVVAPALNTKISDGTAVTVKVGKPVTLTIDGKTVTRWTTALTLDDALAQFNLDDADNILSTNRSTALGREGLQVSVTTPKTVTITSKLGTTTVEVPGNATVGDALKKAGITLDSLDKVSAKPESPVSAGQKITYQDVAYRPIVVTSDVAYDVKEQKDATLPKGETKVITKGVKGQKQTFITQVYLDGKLVSNNHKTGEKVVKQPVTEVIAVGTKQPETSSNNSSPSSTSTAPKTTSTPSTTSSTPKSGGYSGSCEASMYWQGQMTATGETFNPWGMTAAHKTLPFGTKLKVTNVANGKSVVVTINDRGPYIGGRCLDLAKGAFLQIAPESAGVAQVTYVQV
ncbi:septal ring lytic transglycosylase RlpA family protein [Propionibacteriaceae bacterium G1746]|uniref:septal ring lytic transglycosylase RlpA family protein n=1 Tax=Aestuariimicrobium sp. G57 TaxID=3418485 RepID=UPI003C260AAA